MCGCARVSVVVCVYVGVYKHDAYGVPVSMLQFGVAACGVNFETENLSLFQARVFHRLSRIKSVS